MRFDGSVRFRNSPLVTRGPACHITVLRLFTGSPLTDTSSFSGSAEGAPAGYETLPSEPEPISSEVATALSVYRILILFYSRCSLGARHHQPIRSVRPRARSANLRIDPFRSSCRGMRDAHLAPYYSGTAPISGELDEEFHVRLRTPRPFRRAHDTAAGCAAGAAHRRGSRVPGRVPGLFALGGYRLQGPCRLSGGTGCGRWGGRHGVADVRHGWCVGLVRRHRRRSGQRGG
jgi:hypothetical protein